MATLFKNCYLVTPGFEREDMSVLVENGKIVTVNHAYGQSIVNTRKLRIVVAKPRSITI